MPHGPFAGTTWWRFSPKITNEIDTLVKNKLTSHVFARTTRRWNKMYTVQQFFRLYEWLVRTQSGETDHHNYFKLLIFFFFKKDTVWCSANKVWNLYSSASTVHCFTRNAIYRFLSPIQLEEIQTFYQKNLDFDNFYIKPLGFCITSGKIFISLRPKQTPWEQRLQSTETALFPQSVTHAKSIQFSSSFSRKKVKCRSAWYFERNDTSVTLSSSLYVPLPFELLAIRDLLWGVGNRRGCWICLDIIGTH